MRGNMKKFLKQTVSVLMAFTMLFSMAAGADFSASADQVVYGEDIVEYARDYLGCKYEYAHNGPNTFDCSGFVNYVFGHFGISLPRSSGEYWNNASAYGTVVAENSIADAQPGDIISWYNSKARHVAIYTGNGYVIEAANSRLGVVERQYDLIKANGNYKVIRVYGVQPKPDEPLIILGVAENLLASKITGIAVNISWTPVEFADGYLVQLLTNPNGEWQNAGTTITAEFNFRNLTFNHYYSVRVKPFRYSNFDIVYGDSWSRACGFATLSKEAAAAALPIMDIIRFSGVTENSVQVSYSAVWGANRYCVQSSTDKVNWKTVFETSDTAVTLNGLEADTSYYVRIMPYAVSGNETARPDRYSAAYRFYTVPKQAELSLFSFEDLDNYKSYSGYVAYTSVYNSYIAGTNPPEYTLFSPTVSITRAMFVAILYRMAGNPYDEANPHTENPFTDIYEDAYYYNAACWALDENITNQTTFKPNDDVTREQTARFLFAYAQAKHLIGDTDYKYVNLKGYPDFDDVHSWAVEPLQWANYNSMITGTSQGYLNPQGATQRIHATRILSGFGHTCNLGNLY